MAFQLSSAVSGAALCCPVVPPGLTVTVVDRVLSAAGLLPAAPEAGAT